MSSPSIHTDMLTLFTEIACIFLALVFGIFAFRFMDRFFRVLFLQVFVWSVFYGLSYLITSYQQAHQLPIDNQWFLNVHLFLETGLLLAAAWFVVPTLFGRPLIVGAFMLFSVVFVLQAWTESIRIYLNYADVTACLVLTIVYSMVLYTFSQRSKQPLWRSPEKWACLGILLYFACSVPYVSIMNYLQEHHPTVNTFLYYLISGVLANLRYLLLALAFLMIYRTSTKQIHTP